MEKKVGIFSNFVIKKVCKSITRILVKCSLTQAKYIQKNRGIFMSKKSPTEFVRELSPSSQKSYRQSIKKYEQYHNLTISELVDEALIEQRNNVPEDMLKIYDRLMDFRSHCIESGLKYNTVSSHYTRICKVYRMNRIRIPYIPPMNPKRVNRSPEIEFEDILTKDELRKIMGYFNPEERIRAMAMLSGGFATQEAENLTKAQFFEDLKPYHQCEDYHEAMVKLSQMDNVIWVTKLKRQKTAKAYYGLVSPECVQMIAEVRQNDKSMDGKLFECNMEYFSRKCNNINYKLGLGEAGDRAKLTTHAFRRFHATNINGGVLSYEERLKVEEVDELQGRGKTSTQSAYMKTSRLHQKLLYAKVLNNISLYNTYSYEIIDGDVVVYCIDSQSKIRKLAEENKELKRNLKNNNNVSPTLKNYIQDVGLDHFIDMVKELSQ